jgi:hypothetical protein
MLLRTHTPLLALLDLVHLGSRSIEAFFVVLGAEMIVASTQCCRP